MKAMIEILLLVALAFCAAAMAILGGHVSLKPPAKKKVARYRAYFWLLAITSFCLSLLQGIRGIKASNDLATGLNKVEQNTERHAEFQMSNIQSVNLPVTGSNLIHNVHFKNLGSRETLGYGRDGAYSFIGKPRLTESEQKDLQDEFNQWWGAPGSHIYRLAPSQPGEDSYVTSQGPMLNEQEASQLEAGTQLIYVLARIEYRDKYGTHVQDFCNVSQRPQNTLSGTIVAYHSCPSEKPQ